MSAFEFDTAVSRADNGTWLGNVQRGWRTGKVPNGGYILAIAGRVLREALPHRDPLGVNALYLAPTHLGPIECQVEVLRSSRNNTHATVKMSQLGELKVQVTAIYTDLDALQGEDWLVEPRPFIAPVAECENAANTRKLMCGWIVPVTATSVSLMAAVSCAAGSPIAMVAHRT